jgi:ureidoglycolate hydrolase
MRFSDPYHPEKITTVERHVETDEAFVLFMGKCLLFVGDGETHAERLLPQVMEPLKLYNIKRNVWHTIDFSRDASLLIVENRETGPHNTQFATLAPEQKRLIVKVSGTV